MRELSLVWEHALPLDLPQAVAVDALGRPFLHVALKQGGLAVLDVTGRGPPREAARLGVRQLGGLDVMHLAQSGEQIFLALGDFFNAGGAPAGLAVVNVKEPRRPRVTALWRSDEVLRGSAVVLVEGSCAYLGAMSAGVMLFDISQPGRIERLSVFQPDIHFPAPNPKKVHHPNARGLALRQNQLFVAFDAGGLRVLDVADRRQPRETGRYVNAAMQKKTAGVQQRGARR